MKKSLLLTGLFALGAVVVPLNSGQTSSAARVEISNTGPGSKNIISYWSRYKSRMSIYNNTDVDFDNRTRQRARSGNAYVSYNTNGGHAHTGNADNMNHTMGYVDVHNDNSGYHGCDDECGDGHIDASITNTGPRSHNRISSNHRRGSHKNVVKNDTDVDIDNDTHQTASTGDAKVKYNTDAGDAMTSDADNINDTEAAVAVENHNDGGDCGCEGGEVSGVIDTTGPHSTNMIKLGGHGSGHYKVDNDTDVDVYNKTRQSAHTGDAVVAYNTYGGNATSGYANNDNATDVDVHVVNNNGSYGDCDCYGGGEASIYMSGPGSYNAVYGSGYGGGYSYHVDNDTKINFDNYTNQHASTGNAYVMGNTLGGSATSGSASNTNSTVFSANIVNN